MSICMLVNEPIRTPLGVRYLQKGKIYSDVPAEASASLIGRGMAYEVVADEKGKPYTREELAGMTVHELRKLAEDAHIPDASVLRKPVLISALVPNEEPEIITEAEEEAEAEA